LNDRVCELAAEFGATLVKPKREWYGFDPIHIMLPQQKEAWRQILDGWSGAQPAQNHSAAMSRPGWRLARPKYRKLFGIVQRCDQPAKCAADGTTLSVY
jgi:hypothetical protein